MTELAATVVGFDAGGSRTRALALRPGGGSGVRRVGPAGAVDPTRPLETVGVLEGMLREMAADGVAELPVQALCAGVAGAGRAAIRGALAAALEETGIARRVLVLTDGEIALHDAHGDGPGLVLVAGTGSVAWGRNRSGRVGRAGGWGPTLGDEGSGHDIALAALRRMTRAADGREGSTDLGPALLERLGLDRPEELVGWVAGARRSEVAALAPVVVELADGGVEPAAEIVAEAVENLKEITGAVLRRLGPWERTPDLGLAGGLLDPGGPLREHVAAAAREMGMRPRERRVDPVRAAARLAAREGGRA